MVSLSVEKAYDALIPKGRPAKSVAIVPQLGKAREKAAKTVGVSHGYFSDASRDPIEGEIAQFRA